ncbi:MAG: tetratricopeptide repeat protein [Chlorobiales bacterium]
MLFLLNDDDVRSKILLNRLADQPKSPAVIGIAEVLCNQGRYSEAITRLRSVLEFYGDIYRFNLVLARAYRDAGEMELAKQHYEKACQIAPQNEVAIKELIALIAFPRVVSQPLARVVEPSEARETAPALSPLSPKKSEVQVHEAETPSVFNLDREKLSKALGGVFGNAEKSDTQPIETQKPSSSAPAAASPVVEAFRKTDKLLEQEPDIDALAREMMGGNTFVVQENMAQDTLEKAESEGADRHDRTSSEPVLQQQSKNDEARRQRMESEADIDAIARQMMGIELADSPLESASKADSQAGLAVPKPTPSSATSEPMPTQFDENGNPIIRIDRNKLTQALSGIHRAKGIVPSATHSDEGEDDDMPFPMPTQADVGRTPTPASSPLDVPMPSYPESKGALSFEEEIMAMQMQGGDIDAFIANKDTAHRDNTNTNDDSANDSISALMPSPNDEDDIDALARQIMNAQLPKVEETNDPTPISEQRQPFSDDDIKTPTRQLAKIFQTQGAYAKAIKVYEMLAEREPENASLYDILISELREKMNASR